MKIREVMVSPVVTCIPDMTLDAVALLMWQTDCGSVPVVNDQSIPLGIVTDRDIAMGAALQHRPLWEIQVQAICDNQTLYCCKTTDDVDQAVQIMMEHAVRRLPVTSRGKLAGIVSLGDLVARCNIGKNAALPIGKLAAMLKAVSAHHEPLSAQVIA